MKTDQEKLSEYSQEMTSNPNPVTRWSYRQMYLALYYELYVVR